MFISCPCPTLIQPLGQVFLESPIPMDTWEEILQTHTFCLLGQELDGQGPGEAWRRGCLPNEMVVTQPRLRGHGAVAGDTHADQSVSEERQGVCQPRVGDTIQGNCSLVPLLMRPLPAYHRTALASHMVPPSLLPCDSHSLLVMGG